jgi:hypothetical protein
MQCGGEQGAEGNNYVQEELSDRKSGRTSIQERHNDCVWYCIDGRTKLRSVKWMWRVLSIAVREMFCWHNLNVGEHEFYTAVRRFLQLLAPYSALATTYSSIPPAATSRTSALCMRIPKLKDHWPKTAKVNRSLQCKKSCVYLEQGNKF